MGKLGRVALSALALACACSSPRSERGGAASEQPLERVAVEQLSQPVDDRFDAQGALKPSERRFAWLELPMGFRERPGSTARAGSFEAVDMPYTKVRDYLDARLLPAKLELASNGIYFRRAKPAHTQLALEPLDVTLLEIDAATKTVRLLIDDLSPPPEPPLAVEAAREQLAQERNRIE